jgi:hypothetical protein
MVTVTIKQRARRAANEFKAGRGRAWAWVGDRDMIIDAVCMDEIRAAYCVSAETISPAEIMEFRSMFVENITKMGYLS